MRIPCVAMALIVVGCGGPDFGGTYDGTLTQRAQCADGSTPSRDIVMHLSVTQDGDTINLAGNTSCGTITASVDGDTATLDPVTCAPLAGEGFTYTDSIVGGTMTLSGSRLEVDAVMSTLLRAPNGATLLCSGPLTGALHRRQ